MADPGAVAPRRACRSSPSVGRVLAAAAAAAVLVARGDLAALNVPSRTSTGTGGAIGG